MITPASRPVLIVLPQRDFDPSEVAVTWKVLGDAGNTVIFATPDGRTYLEVGAEPFGYRSVQAEVSRALASADDFCDVPREAADHFRKTSGLFRDSAKDQRASWVVRDRRYVSARWPGDVHAFAAAFATVLAEYRAVSATR
jgi:hypothetical protein